MTGRLEQPGLAQGAREFLRVKRGCLVGHQLVNTSVFFFVVEEIQLLVMVETEGDDLLASLRYLAVADAFVFVKLACPKFSGHPIAADVMTLQFLQASAAVDKAASDRSRLGVREADVWAGYGRGPTLALRVHHLGAFHHRPAIVAAGPHPVDHLIHFPTHIPHPQVACRLIKTHAPRVAKTIGPHLVPGLGQMDERVVRRDGVRQRLALGVLALFVHIDPQDRAEQVTDILACLQTVGRGRVGGVSGGDVQEAVLAKVQITPVVSAAQPSQQHTLGGHIEVMGAVEAKFRYPCSLRMRAVLSANHIAQVAEPVFGKSGVECQTIESLKATVLLGV